MKHPPRAQNTSPPYHTPFRSDSYLHCLISAVCSTLICSSHGCPPRLVVNPACPFAADGSVLKANVALTAGPHRPTGVLIDAFGDAFEPDEQGGGVTVVDAAGGSATLVHDRAKIDELWTPMVKPWFPEGKDDPKLTLLRVDIDDAEYWDSNSSRMVRALAMAASIVAGKPIGMGDNEKVVNPG